MYELLQNLLVMAWNGPPADDAGDVGSEEAAAGAGERLHRDLDACFQAIQAQISEREP